MEIDIEVYRKALENARAELSETQKSRDSLDTRITKLRQTIASLASLCGESQESQEEGLGIKELVELVLKDAKSPKFVSEIKPEVLKRLGSRHTDYTNVPVMIHTALQRFFNAGEVIEHETDEGKKKYVLNGTGIWDYDNFTREAMHSGCNSVNTVNAFMKKKHGVSGKIVKGHIKESLKKGQAMGIYKLESPGVYALKAKAAAPAAPKTDD